MLQSTFEKILPQMEGLCDKLGIDPIHRNAIFTSPRDRCDRYLPTGLIVVDVGEVHVGTAYRLNFDIDGKLVAIFEFHWAHDGEVQYIDVTENQCTADAILCAAKEWVRTK